MHRNLSPTSSVDLNLSGGGSRGFGEFFKESKSCHLSSSTVVETTTYGEINVVIEEDEEISTTPATKDVKIHPLAQLFKAAVAAGTFIVSTSAANLQHFKSKHSRLPTPASPQKPLSSDPTIAVSPSPTKSQQSTYGSSTSPSKPFHRPISTLVTSLKRSSHAVASTVAATTTSYRQRSDKDKEVVESELSSSSVHDTDTNVPASSSKTEPLSSSILRPFHKTGHSAVPSTATAQQNHSVGGANTTSPPSTPPKPSSNADAIPSTEWLVSPESPRSEPFLSFQESPLYLQPSSQGSSPHSILNPLWQTAVQHTNNDKATATANAAANKKHLLHKAASAHSYLLEESSSTPSCVSSTYPCESSFEHSVYEMFNTPTTSVTTATTTTTNNTTPTAATTIPPIITSIPATTKSTTTLHTTTMPTSMLSDDSDDPFGPPSLPPTHPLSISIPTPRIKTKASNVHQQKPLAASMMTSDMTTTTATTKYEKEVHDRLWERTVTFQDQPCEKLWAGGDIVEAPSPRPPLLSTTNCSLKGTSGLARYSPGSSYNTQQRNKLN